MASAEEGVDESRTNCLINKLKERREMQQQLKKPKISCTNCEKRERCAVARCMECRDFLCQRCYNSHSDMRTFKSHRMCSMEEMRSGQAFEEEYCEKHKEQVLSFYCKTCEKLICRDCTVGDHCGRDHQYVTLESAIAEQREEIKRLSADCTLLGQHVRDAIAENKTTKQNLEAAVESALQTIDITTDKILEKFKKTLDASCQKPKADIQKWQANVTQNISENDATLQNQQARLHTALEMVSQVIELGSQYDIAAIHAELTNSLKQLKQIKPVSVKPSLSNVKFKANAYYTPEMPYIGNLTLGPQRQPGDWVVENQFGQEGADKLEDALDVVVSPNTDIAVTDHASQVNIYSSDGQLKHKLETRHDFKPGKKSQPERIVVNTNGYYFVTDNTQYVKLFNPQGLYKSRFPAISPGKLNTPSDAEDTRLVGLALDTDGHILVGCFNKKYISKHQQDGKHVSSIKVSMTPQFLTVIPNGNIVISEWSIPTGAQIITQTGQLLHTLNAPPGVEVWNTTGVCCSENIIYIANARTDSDAGIYCFSVTGEYLGCATKEVTDPRGLAITDDGCKLIVTNDFGKKLTMFRLK